MNDTIEETDEEREAAEAALRDYRSRKALGQAAELAAHVRSLINSPERGEVLSEYVSPMKLSPTDDIDALYAELINWVSYWSRWLEMTPTATSVVAWRNNREVQGFRAGTTPNGAGMLVRLQTMWLLSRADMIARHPAGAEYQEVIASLVWSLKSRYPTTEKRKRDVSPRPCTLCGEPEVGAEWGSENPLDVKIECGHCGLDYPTTARNIAKWLTVDATTVAYSEECLVAQHARCPSVHCECSCHVEPIETIVRPPQRIQMSRREPWRTTNPEAVIVARPSKWGNPFAVGGIATDRAHAVNMFANWLTNTLRDGRYASGSDDYHGVAASLRPSVETIRAELGGRDLACWCPLDQPCHADVLLELANR